MSITKTLGGDRLGSGNRMKVHMHGYDRSSHNMGYLWRSTMAPGTLVPFMSEVALPGDTWDIDLDCDVKTHPTIGPLFGSFKVQLDVFLVPMRLYNAMLHNNMLNIGRNMAAVKLPLMELLNTNVDEAVDLDNSQINPSSILKYLGLSGVGKGAGGTARQFNAVPLLAYWEIYKNYYSNKQEEVGMVLHTPLADIVETVDAIAIRNTTGDVAVPEEPGVSLAEVVFGSKIVADYTGAQPDPNNIMINTTRNGWRSIAELATIIDYNTGQIEATYNQAYWGNDTVTQWRYRDATDINNIPPIVTSFPLSNIDDMRLNLMQAPTGTAFILDEASIAPYGYPLAQVDGVPNALGSQEGLGVKTYNSDLFNNWLSTEWVDQVNEQSAISTVGDQFTVDSLILAKKVYNMLNRIMVSGGTYNDWQEAVYDHGMRMQAESPIYMGGLIKELVFQEVVSNSQSGGEQAQPLGTLAGKGVMARKHKGGKIIIKVDEASYIMGIVSLTPRIDYSQGNKWDMHLKTIDDLHKPPMDGIGFQDLITEQMAWWDTTYSGGIWAQNSAGKQPAWMNYRTNVNKTYGNFAVATNEMFMTLNRRYQNGEDRIADLTTYIDPAKFNFIFAETTLDAQNFWVQIAVDATARRKMSAVILPNL